jgi:hypothetical protein
MQPMEKLDVLVWSDDAVTVSRAARLDNATLLMGRGSELAGLVQL